MTGRSAARSVAVEETSVTGVTGKGSGCRAATGDGTGRTVDRLVSRTTQTKMTGAVTATLGTWNVRCLAGGASLGNQSPAEYATSSRCPAADIVGIVDSLRKS
jgi:hypothetical protein